MVALAAGVATLAGACGPPENVDIEPLPPLTRPTAEARAGLPQIAGIWRFAGWEVASAQLAYELGEPLHPGELVLQTQRLDSLAGYLARGEQRIPLVGELRRDGTLSLVAADANAAARFAAGRVARDTLWLELSTLPAGELSPPTLRWAFVRGTVGQPTLRLPSGVLLRDTLALAPEPVDTPRAVEVQPAAPPATAPPATAPPRPTEERQPPPAARPPVVPPAPRPQAPPPETPDPETPEPQPSPQAEPPLPDTVSPEVPPLA